MPLKPLFPIVPDEDEEPINDDDEELPGEDEEFPPWDEEDEED